MSEPEPDLDADHLEQVFGVAQPMIRRIQQRRTFVALDIALEIASRIIYWAASDKNVHDETSGVRSLERQFAKRLGRRIAELPREVTTPKPH